MIDYEQMEKEYYGLVSENEKFKQIFNILDISSFFDSPQKQSVKETITLNSKLKNCTNVFFQDGDKNIRYAMYTDENGKFFL